MFTLITSVDPGFSPPRSLLVVITSFVSNSIITIIWAYISSFHYFDISSPLMYLSMMFLILIKCFTFLYLLSNVCNWLSIVCSNICINSLWTTIWIINSCISYSNKFSTIVFFLDFDNWATELSCFCLCSIIKPSIICNVEESILTISCKCVSIMFVRS